MDILNEEEKDDTEKMENSKINNENFFDLEDVNIDIESWSDIETKYNNYNVFNEIGKKLENINLNNNNEDHDINNIILNKLKNPKPRKRKHMNEEEYLEEKVEDDNFKIKKKIKYPK